MLLLLSVMKEGTTRTLRTALEFREELAENLIGNRRVPQHTPRPPEMRS